GGNRSEGTASSSGGAGGGSYTAGRYSVNVLPSPAVLVARISPPSSRAISRLIERPSPVPPYFRLVVPSACWNASNTSRSFSGGTPMPVSLTESATTCEARDSTGLENRTSSGAGPIDRLTEPASVHLNAFESRFF